MCLSTSGYYYFICFLNCIFKVEDIFKYILQVFIQTLSSDTLWNIPQRTKFFCIDMRMWTECVNKEKSSQMPTSVILPLAGEH